MTSHARPEEPRLDHRRGRAVPPLPDGDERFGLDMLRGLPDGFAGSSGSTNFGDGRVEFAWLSDAPEWHFETLRPHQPMLFQVEIWSAPDSFGLPPSGVVWESPDVLLGDGEQRELVADLRGLQPGG